jgi:pilus assembly protein Flp/PilA
LSVTIVAFILENQQLKNYTSLSSRRFASATRGASLVEYGILTGLVAVVALGAVVGLGLRVDGVFTDASESIGSETDLAQAPAEPVAAAPLTSCQDAYNRGNRTDGVYAIESANGSMNVACHFETSGGLAGGWTVVANQFEATPAYSWSTGIAADRSSAEYFFGSFALAPNQIPAHSAIAFGRYRAGALEILDGVSGTYTTGDLNQAGAVSLRNGFDTYDIHRDATAFYGSHDPENGNLQYMPSEWYDTLTFDLRFELDRSHTWAFSPRQPDPRLAGYSYDGTLLQDDVQNYAWVVYVR